MKIFSEELVEKAASVCKVADISRATIGEVLLVAQYLEKETGIPFIRMDKTVTHAVMEGAHGWFAPSDAEAYYAQYGTSLSICGGLGAGTVSAMEPLAIHRRVQALVDDTHSRGYLIGSGGEIAEAAYLSLISMLGIYIRCH